MHDEEDLERLADARRLRSGYRVAARRALAFARLYREEEGRAGGDRERACIDQARAWRAEAHAVTVANVGQPRPGLARARSSDRTGEAATKTG